MTTTERMTHGWCPSCKEDSAVDSEGNCLWCDTPARLHAPKRRSGWKRPDLRGSKYTEPQLRAMHIAHVRGLSLNELAKRTYEQVGYASHASAASAISREWKQLGLDALDRIESTVRSSTKHGRGRRNRNEGAYRRWFKQTHGRYQPRCVGAKTQAPGKGERCSRPAKEGSKYCPSHDPARELQRQAHLARVRRRQPRKPMVSMAPFSAWLRRQHDRLGTWAAVADEVGLSVSGVHAYARGVGTTTKQPKATIGEDVARRYMGSAFDLIYVEPDGEWIREAA